MVGSFLKKKSLIFLKEGKIIQIQEPKLSCRLSPDVHLTLLCVHLCSQGWEPFPPLVPPSRG